jgi:hypothetical protein
VGRKPHAARLGRVADHMLHQTHEAVDEVLPRPWLAVEAAIQQVSINIRECHAKDLDEIRMPLGPVDCVRGPISILDKECARNKSHFGRGLRRVKKRGIRGVLEYCL